MALIPTPQEDFALGIVRATARDLIPPNGAYDLLNYLLDSDGDVYRRGGAVSQSNAGLGALGLTFIWSGHLQNGPRTLFAGPGGYGVFEDDGETPFDLGGRGLSRPAKAHAIGGLLYIDGGDVYAGSRKASYSTGLVNVTNGSRDVIRTTAGEWGGNADDGMIFRSAGDMRSYVVRRIFAGDVLELTEPYEGPTATGKTYTLAPIGDAALTADFYAVVGKRLLAFDVEDSAVRFSGWDAPGSFDPNDEHVIPGGVELLGGAGIRDTALIFTTGGVWLIQNLALEAVDGFGNVQHQLALVNPGLILWGKEGIASWQESLVVPAVDGVWLMDANGSTERLERSITPLYAEYVNRGYRPGLATVFRSHYLLPILAAGNRVVDVLVCRLDRPSRSRIGTIYPWTRLNGKGADVRGYAVHLGPDARSPQLLAASARTSSRVLNATRYFDPDADVADDEGEGWTTDLVTRDFPTGRGNQNVVRWLDLMYELREDLGGTPEIAAAFGVGARISGQTEWGGFDWGQADWSPPSEDQFHDLAGTAPAEMEGIVPKRWAVIGPDGAPRTRHIRFRLRTSDPAANLRIRGLVMWSRQSTRAD